MDKNQLPNRRIQRFLDDLNWASTTYGASRREVISQLMRLHRRHGFRPAEAHHEGLSNPRLGSTHLDAVISKADLVALQTRLNSAMHIGMTEDKAVFYWFARAVGLPIPKLYGVVDCPVGWDAEGNPLRGPQAWRKQLETLEGEIIVKPALGVHGQGVRAFRRVNGSFQDLMSAEILTPESFASLLCSDPWSRLIVQQRMVNHPEIMKLTGSVAFQTVRVQTLLTPEGPTVLGGSIFKVVVGHQVIDNIVGGATGNLRVPVRFDDGRLGVPVAYSKSGRGIQSIPSHPITGLKIEGFQLPCWEEVKALARRAAELFSPVRTIGWDIGFSVDGPVLIEGNPWWDPSNTLAGVPEDESYVNEATATWRALRSEAER